MDCLQQYESSLSLLPNHDVSLCFTTTMLLASAIQRNGHHDCLLVQLTLMSIWSRDCIKAPLVLRNSTEYNKLSTCRQRESFVIWAASSLGLTWASKKKRHVGVAYWRGLIYNIERMLFLPHYSLFSFVSLCSLPQTPYPSRHCSTGPPWRPMRPSRAPQQYQAQKAHRWAAGPGRSLTRPTPSWRSWGARWRSCCCLWNCSRPSKCNETQMV